MNWPPFARALDYFRDRFGKWEKSPLRDRAHVPGACRAIFDEEYRRWLISQKDVRGIAQSADDCPFSAFSFELLEELRKTPTKAFYDERQDEFREALEEPFQRLLLSVGDELPDPMKGALETKKRVFARIPKNDYGRGGAHAYYWGAFFPQGGRRIADAQLFLWMNADVLDFGFYIGEYASEQRERFLRNVVKHRALLLEKVAPQLAGQGLDYGPRRGFIDPGGTDRTFDDFRTWLDEVDRESIRVMGRLSRDEVLASSERELVDRIKEVFTNVYPLFLLATLDEPQSGIASFLDEPEVVEPNVEYPLEECVVETGIDAEELNRWVRAIERKGQAIIYGPPGTGKTFIAEKLAQHLIGGGDGFSELVQFHPAYAYEEFVQGIRPRTGDNGRLEYPMQSGRFLEFCDRARRCRDKCVMIIDEINRANLARVFGELMYLLEYRDQVVPLAGGGRFSIPPNVRIIGTMNTADRSIALVDHALRRRFAFIALRPKYDILKRFHAGNNFDPEGLIGVLHELNAQIADPDYEVGITFFLKRDLHDHISDIWQMEIEPYLEEYFFDQPDKVRQFCWKNVAGRILGG